MPLILSDETLAELSNEELLLNCVQEYANENNYIPYEKDYGEGHVVKRMPIIGAGKGGYARDTLRAYNSRINEGGAQALTAVEKACIEQHKLLKCIKQSPQWDNIGMHLQDEINKIIKLGETWT